MLNNTLSKRIKNETNICIKTDNLIHKLNNKNVALLKELKQQYESSKLAQNLCMRSINDEYDTPDSNQIFDAKEFLVDQLINERKLVKRIKERLRYSCPFNERIECLEKIRRIKQKKVLIEETLSSQSDFATNMNFPTAPLGRVSGNVNIRLLGCSDISRSFSMKSIFLGWPSSVRKVFKSTNSMPDEVDNNINAKLRLDIFSNNQLIYSTNIREPNLNCWNECVSLSHNFSQPIEFNVSWISPYPKLRQYIRENLSVYESLDTILASYTYLFLHSHRDNGFITRTLDMYPTGKLLIETFIKPAPKPIARSATLTSLFSIKSLSSKFTISFDDLYLLAVIGKGNFGTIIVCKPKFLPSLLALKAIKKSFIENNNEYQLLIVEKAILKLATVEKHPLIVHIYACIQNKENIMFLMDFVQCGDLWTLKGKLKRFSVEQTRFYLASLVLCIDFLHKHNIMYRDLKMENILLDSNGYIKLVDFGLSKLNMRQRDVTHTFCGTMDYMAPEMLRDSSGYSRSIDWWALGILAYLMMTGDVPFQADTEIDTVRLILHQPLTVSQIPDPYASSFVLSLLNKNACSRLGSRNGSIELKVHPYFVGLKFSSIYFRKFRPPFIPSLTSVEDISYFDKEFTQMPPNLSTTNTRTHHTYQPAGATDSNEFFNGFCCL